MKSKEQNSFTYVEQKQLLTEFINTFQDQTSYDYRQCYKKYANKKYLIEVQKLANAEIKLIQIFIEDLQTYFCKDNETLMVLGFRYNTSRYIKIFQQIIVDILPLRNNQVNPQEQIDAKYMSYLKQQRKDNLVLSQNLIKPQNQKFPFRMNLSFDVSIVYKTSLNPRCISQINAGNIGQLITLKAIVVRTSEVLPQIVVGTYACDVCNCENYIEVSDSYFNPNLQCQTKKCKQQNMSGKLNFLPAHSKFRSLQQLKIQETPEQLQRGAIPKSKHIKLRGSLVNQAKPGDIVRIQGIVKPRQNKINLYKKQFLFDSCIEVTQIIRQKKKYVQLNISEGMKKKVLDTRNQMDDDLIFDNLAASIAPQIYGMENVKKALLLQMAGGVTAETEDNLRIRGQINIALFGDPGIAKSQLLKHISYISPRAVYTTGKGSSGVGLTASIVSDPTTKQLSLEAGALVLADMGICCIDEFDKMDEYDRTSIHEVMQQQTVSITKAGIITTLNARTAVLAAANPCFGRYNKNFSTQKNLNLPAALLSRFDLIFVLLDQPDKKRDFQLALHIGKVHQKKKIANQGVFDQQFLKAYIALSKSFHPEIPQNIHEKIILKYIQKRQLQKDASKQGQSYTTMRSLLALIRLSQARAKLRFSNQVSIHDVLESIQIIEDSQRSIEIKPLKKLKTDATSLTFELIKELCYYKEDLTVNIQLLKSRATSRGISNNQVEITIKFYKSIGALSVINEKFITLIP